MYRSTWVKENSQHDFDVAARGFDFLNSEKMNVSTVISTPLFLGYTHKPMIFVVTYGCMAMSKGVTNYLKHQRRLSQVG